MIEIPPFLLYYAAALLVPFLRGWVRGGFLLLVPIAGFLAVLGADPGISYQVSLLQFDLALFRVDRLSSLFGYLFNIAAFLGLIFSLHLKEEEGATVQHAAALSYAGSALGAVFAGDFITLFLFWEMLGLTSVFLIWARHTPEALASGTRYLLISVLSGVILLAGALLHSYETGSLLFDFVGLDGLASWLILIAFGIKSAFPLVHNWLTDGYPNGTPTGTVFLSAFTTKVAVYSLARAFPGTELLVYVGVTMACFPIFYAVIENDLRRVLGYSMINQIGFMVAGIGVGTAMGVNGAVAHAFNDVIFKGLLMMTMGAVLYRTGRINGSDLGGLYKSMPITAGLCMVGAASISAFPLFSGFVSKSMVMAAVLEEGHTWVWLLFLFASAGVFHHAGIKIPYFAFFAHDSGIRVKEAPRNMLVAMSLGAILCVVLGSFPRFLYSLLPFPVEYVPYTATHVLTQLQLLFFSAGAFVWLNLKHIYPPELRSVNLDVEWTYRALGPRVVAGVGAAFSSVSRSVGRRVGSAPAALAGSVFGGDGPQAALGRTWPTGSMVLWAVVLLGAYLLIGLF